MTHSDNSLPTLVDLAIQSLLNGKQLDPTLLEQLRQFEQFQVACKDVEWNDRRLAEDGLPMPQKTEIERNLDVSRRAVFRLASKV